jgi:hypothetical protein
MAVWSPDGMHGMGVGVGARVAGGLGAAVGEAAGVGDADPEQAATEIARKRIAGAAERGMVTRKLVS